MIKYTLKCGREHRFDAWFRSCGDCDAQLAARQVTCPHCGGEDVCKSMMAPRLGGKAERDPVEPPAAAPPAPPATTPAALRGMMEARLRALRSYVESTAEHVGPRFAEEARRIHFEEADKRAIYGEASADEVESLREDGVPCAPVPWIDRRDD